MDELIDLIEYICLRGVIGVSVVRKNLVLNEYEDARWFGKDELMDVKWLSVDTGVVEVVKDMTMFN